MESNTPHLAYEPIAEDYANELDNPKMHACCREMFLNYLPINERSKYDVGRVMMAQNYKKLDAR